MYILLPPFNLTSLWDIKLISHMAYPLVNGIMCKYKLTLWHFYLKGQRSVKGQISKKYRPFYFHMFQCHHIKQHQLPKWHVDVNQVCTIWWFFSWFDLLMTFDLTHCNINTWPLIPDSGKVKLWPTNQSCKIWSHYKN